MDSNDDSTTNSEGNAEPAEISDEREDETEKSQVSETEKSDGGGQPPALCLMCQEGIEVQNLIKLNETSLKKCLETIEMKNWCVQNIPKCKIAIRTDINWPAEGSCGGYYYHSSCYKRFNTVNGSYRSAFKDIVIAPSAAEM